MLENKVVNYTLKHKTNVDHRSKLSGFNSTSTFHHYHEKMNIFPKR